MQWLAGSRPQRAKGKSSRDSDTSAKDEELSGLHVVGKLLSSKLGKQSIHLLADFYVSHRYTRET